MFSEASIRKLLGQVASGDLAIDQAVVDLKTLPFESLNFATLDHHRQFRHAFGEVVYCEGKTPDQVAQIVGRLAQVCPRVLATRATREQFTATRHLVKDLAYDEAAQAIWLDREPQRTGLPGTVVVAAGTSDMPAVNECELTLKLMGHVPHMIRDVGVAGLHRLLHHIKTLQKANVIVAVAGMEGALPSVIGGLVNVPVIAVPTSVGYGASFDGLAALLAMLNSCAAGVCVVNIDNGFGAGYLAAMINRRIHDAGDKPEP